MHYEVRTLDKDGDPLQTFKKDSLPDARAAYAWCRQNGLLGVELIKVTVMESQEYGWKP